MLFNQRVTFTDMLQFLLGERRFSNCIATVSYTHLGGLAPMTTNLVVADLTRTEKTICLAVTPALKAYGILGRARLFEVIQKVREINAQRRQRVPSHVFSGSSSNDLELRANPALELDYIVAPPRMARYMEWSARIYQVYLRHVAPEDIHQMCIRDRTYADPMPRVRIASER